MPGIRPEDVPNRGGGNLEKEQGIVDGKKKIKKPNEKDKKGVITIPTPSERGRRPGVGSGKVDIGIRRKGSI